MRYIFRFSFMTTIVAAIAPASFAQLAKTDEPFPGQQWAVACKTLPVHTDATAFSKVKGQLSFGTTVVIKNLTGKFVLPDSQQSSASGGETTSEPQAKFAWAEVSSANFSGFVPMSCLVNGNLAQGPHENPADLFQKPISVGNVADRGFSKKEKGDQVAMRGMSGKSEVTECDDATISSRGFSKKEKGDQVAMRGMSKSTEVICVREDFVNLAKTINALPEVNNPHEADLEFRRVGNLGEFKK